MGVAGRAGIVASRRVAFVARDAGRLVRFRGPLLQAVAGRGHQILCLTADAEPAAADALRALGAAHAVVPMNPGPLSMLGDRGAVANIRAALSAWGPNVVLGLGLKPMVMAAVAARRLPEARIVLVASSLAGLGSDARDSGSPGKLSVGERWLLRRALGRADVLVTHNSEDEQMLARLAVVPPGLVVRVQPGAGVDLVRFAPEPMPGSGEGLVFTMIAPRDPAKGLAEFIEAARRTKARVPKTRFVLAVDEKPDAAGRTGFPLEGIAGEIKVVPAGDVAGLLAATHVFVLPSHREGFAQAVAEALACGRPAITSDIAGCRVIVDERVSGVLIPPRDAVALGQAIDSFLRRPEDIAWMGQAARRKAERRFDVRAINAELLDIMDLAHEAAQ